MHKRVPLSLSAAVTLAVTLSVSAAVNPTAVRKLSSTPSSGIPVNLAKGAVSSRKLTNEFAMTAGRHLNAATDLSLAWGLCNSPQQAYGVGPGLLKQAVRIPAGILSQFAEGNMVTAVLVGNPADASTFNPSIYEYDNPVSECEVWVARTLDGEPIAKGKGSLGEYAFHWSTIMLDTPIDVPADEEVYMGVTMTVPEGESICGLVTDYSYPYLDDTNLAYTKVTGWDDDYEPIFGDEYGWRSLGKLVGNACLRLQIEGPNLPVNVLEDMTWFMPTVVMPGEPFPVECTFLNMGANRISSVELTMEIGSQAVQTVTVDRLTVNYDENWEPIYGEVEYNQYAVATAEFTSLAEGNNLPFNVYVSAINGTPVDYKEEGYTGTLLSISEGFPKNNVCEEGTGTWCGMCVAGIAGMEYMAQEYPEGQGFIGVALHGGQDVMDVMGNGGAFEWTSDNYPGFPLAFFNRNFTMEVSPSPEDLRYYMWDYGEYPAMAAISATLSQSDAAAKTVLLTTAVEFSLSEDNAQYGIAYTVMEDGVGPYTQANGYSGEDDFWSWGYGSQPPYIKMMYNDVARNCSHPLPLEGSVPESIRPGETYDYSVTVSLDDVTDLNHYRIVAMVVNRLNGAIENACMVKSPTYDYASVKSVSSAPDMIAFGCKGGLTVRATGSEASVYSADGRCVASGVKGGRVELPAGLYIVTTHKASAKVWVK